MVDSVHYCPHYSVDVQDLGCDFMVCSTFKFFGPHAGLLFGKKTLLQDLRPYKLEVSRNALPSEDNQVSRWEPGTLNFEGLAGITAVIQYFASLGVRFGNGKLTAIT